MLHRKWLERTTAFIAATTACAAVQAAESQETEASGALEEVTITAQKRVERRDSFRYFGLRIAANMAHP